MSYHRPVRRTQAIGLTLAALAAILPACPGDETPPLRQYADLPAAPPPKAQVVAPPLRELEPTGPQQSAIPAWALAEGADGGVAPVAPGADLPAPCATGAWARAKPGDFVEYRLDDDPPTVLRAEVAAVGDGTVLVRASARRADGTPLPMPGGGTAELIVPFAATLGSWRPLARAGNVHRPLQSALDEDALVLGRLPHSRRIDDVEAGGRSWSAVEETLKPPHGEGPAVTLVRTEATGALYLTRGILSWEAWAPGAHGPHPPPGAHERLSLRAFGHDPAPPGVQGVLRYAAGPRQYVLLSTEPPARGERPHAALLVTAIGEGLLARWRCNPVPLGPPPAPAADRCTPTPTVWDLLEVLRELAGRGGAGRWAFLQHQGKPSAVPLRLGTGPIEAIQYGDGLYAREPWAQELDGAPWDLRFGQLASPDDPAGRALGWSAF